MCQGAGQTVAAPESTRKEITGVGGGALVTWTGKGAGLQLRGQAAGWGRGSGYVDRQRGRVGVRRSVGSGICKVSTRCWHLSCETRVIVSILQPAKLGMKKFCSC